MKKLHTFVVLAYKESSYIEECIKSILQQSDRSEVIIATSTPNDFIKKVSEKYKIQLYVNNDSGKGIGYDFDYALSCADANLVTIAHQDDIYEPTYSEKVIKMYEAYRDALIVFSDYFEIRENEKVFENKNLKIKRSLLSLIKLHKFSNIKFIKRSCLAMGDAICCPAVTFVKENLPYDNIFACDMKCNIDWYAWERLSKEKGRFLFVNDCLMGHRVHEGSTTSEIISNNIRTKEDLLMLEKFWPSWLAKRINRIYVSSEKSNDVKKRITKPY